MPRGSSSRTLRSRSRKAVADTRESESRSPSPAPNMPSLSKSDIEAIFANCLDNDTIVDKLVNKLADKIKSDLVDALSESLGKAHKEIEILKNEIVLLKTKISDVEHRSIQRNDDLEQYTRRTNIRVFGIPERESENTDELIVNLFKDKLKVDIPVEKIDRTHRVGRQPPQASDGTKRWRPIIVRFQSYRDRRVVYSAKKLLKGTGITIREDLTAKRMEVLRAATERFGPKNTWTLDGRVLWVDQQKKKGVATSLSELS